MDSWLNGAHSGAGTQLVVMEEEARTRDAKTLEESIQAWR